MRTALLSLLLLVASTALAQTGVPSTVTGNEAQPPAGATLPSCPNVTTPPFRLFFQTSGTIGLYQCVSGSWSAVTSVGLANVFTQPQTFSSQTCTTPAINFTGATTSGFSVSTSPLGPVFCANAVASAMMRSAVGHVVGSGLAYTWSSTATATGSPDTAISRSAAGTVSFDTTALGNGLDV